jgi:hypothetical protein
MNPAVGMAYLGSLFLLTATVAGIYSIAQEPRAPWGRILRQFGRRSGKLLGVLGALALAVHFLSKI